LSLPSSEIITKEKWIKQTFPTGCVSIQNIEKYSGVDKLANQRTTQCPLPSGPRAIIVKNKLLSFSIFLISWAWSVLNLRHCNHFPGQKQ
jgi:hypothetical protein